MFKSKDHFLFPPAYLSGEKRCCYSSGPRIGSDDGADLGGFQFGHISFPDGVAGFDILIQKFSGSAGVAKDYGH